MEIEILRNRRASAETRILSRKELPVQILDVFPAVKPSDTGEDLFPDTIAARLAVTQECENNRFST